MVFPDLEPVVEWRRDAIEVVFTTVAVALTGPVLGLIWSHLAPTISIAGVAAGSEVPYRAQIGADAWFLLLAAIAGAACAVVALIARRHGPATLLGLAFGGISAAFIADRVGYLASRGDALSALHRVGVKLSVLQQFGIDPFLRVRAMGVIVAWPLASVLVYVLVVAIGARRSLP
jgi:hypothetical protein